MDKQRKLRSLPDATSAFPGSEQLLKVELNHHDSNRDSEIRIQFQEPKIQNRIRINFDTKKPKKNFIIKN